MSLDQLHAVVTIADAGTLVRAARRLHISQPPLTRKVHALEEELGVMLFERSPRGMRPTAAGELLLGRARSILAAVDQAAEEARALMRASVPAGAEAPATALRSDAGAGPVNACGVDSVAQPNDEGSRLASSDGPAKK